MKIMLLFLLAISHQSQAQDSFFTTLESLCDHTLYSKPCFHSLSTLLDSEKIYDPHFIYEISVQMSINEVFRALEDFSENGVMTPTIVDAKRKILLSSLESCRDFLSLALYNINTSLPTDYSVVTAEARANFRTRLSAAGADLQTCLDDFEYAPGEIRQAVAANLEKSTQLVSTSLGIISRIDEYMSLHEEPLTLPTRDSSDALASDWEPAWMSAKDKKTLQNVKKTMKPDAVVAADGSGNYKTINEAIVAVPQMSSKRFVIYVKKGVYLENVVVGMDKWNILMYGDGKDRTVVSSNHSNATGSSVLQSATFSVQGQGFIAMDMGFRNTYGPGSQAVALFSASEKSVFYRCLMDGYQDTLFAHSNHQFYRECDIYGTVDFIFGDAAVVIQNSNILVKKGNTGINVITAQGKDVPQSATGTSIQNCSIQPAENLDGVKTYLGRPWKNYSTTVIMQSKLGSFIDPQGWLPWKGRNPPVPDTLLYVEYNNSGTGADTANRVQWKGVKLRDTQDYARNYTVRSFLDGVNWLPSTGAPFQADL